LSKIIIVKRVPYQPAYKLAYEPAYHLTYLLPLNKGTSLARRQWLNGDDDRVIILSTGDLIAIQSNMIYPFRLGMASPID
jgi:hypothetical protein